MNIQQLKTIRNKIDVIDDKWQKMFRKRSKLAKMVKKIKVNIPVKMKLDREAEQINHWLKSRTGHYNKKLNFVVGRTLVTTTLQVEGNFKLCFYKIPTWQETREIDLFFSTLCELSCERKISKCINLLLSNKLSIILVRAKDLTPEFFKNEKIKIVFKLKSDILALSTIEFIPLDKNNTYIYSYPVTEEKLNNWLYKSNIRIKELKIQYLGGYYNFDF